MSERRYLAPLPLGGDEGPPWSKGLMARALAATGLTPTRAYELARRADADMIQRRALELDLDRLAEVAEEVLGEPEAARTMRRLRRLQALQHLELPVLLLVGGATGTGKSTLATEAAHRLGITRVTSTDFIRQTMRAFFSREFMPSVHYSSFEAELGLSRADEDLGGDVALLGFLDQTRNVLVGVEAAIDRALTEGWSMVLEGVHIVPGMIAVDRADALVVQCVVAITDEDTHRSHFWVRDAATDGLRPLEKYLEGLTEIRMIQDVLLERARRFDVPVIENVSVDDAIGQILDIVLTGAERLSLPYEISNPLARISIAPQDLLPFPQDLEIRRRGPSISRTIPEGARPRAVPPGTPTGGSSCAVRPTRAGTLAPWSPRTTSSRRSTESKIPSSGWTSSRSASSTKPRSTARASGSSTR